MPLSLKDTGGGAEGGEDRWGAEDPSIASQGSLDAPGQYGRPTGGGTEGIGDLWGAEDPSIASQGTLYAPGPYGNPDEGGNGHGQQPAAAPPGSGATGSHLQSAPFPWFSLPPAAANAAATSAAATNPEVRLLTQYASCVSKSAQSTSACTLQVLQLRLHCSFHSLLYNTSNGHLPGQRLLPALLWHHDIFYQPMTCACVTSGMSMQCWT